MYVSDAVRPFIQAANLRLRYARARLRARLPLPGRGCSDAPPPIFVVGCGRSGTTVLARLLGLRADITLLFEPWHLWAVVDPATDVGGFHSKYGLGKFSWVAKSQRARPGNASSGLFSAHGEEEPSWSRRRHTMSREIGWLEALADEARYLHIVRNGLAVAHSIGRIAEQNRAKLAFRPRHNQWWGVDEMKWSALARESAIMGYHPREIEALQSHAQRGAYEWLVSLDEASRWKPPLDDRFVEVTLEDLTRNPRERISWICERLGLDRQDDWVDRAARMIIADQISPGYPLELPPKICEAFNKRQEEYGYSGRADRL